MAQEGLRLPNAFVATPVCSPSRLAIMTGRYASEFGITDWIDPNREPDLGIPVGTVTWPQLIAQSGYRTGLVGKWHLGTRETFIQVILVIIHFGGFLGGGVTTKIPLLEIDGRSAERPGLAVELVTDLALEFLEQADDRPWLLSVHYREPHALICRLPSRLEEFEAKSVAISEYPELDRPLVTTADARVIGERGWDRRAGWKVWGSSTAWASAAIPLSSSPVTTVTTWAIMDSNSKGTPNGG